MFIIRSGRHPHEVSLLVACCVIGLAGLIAPNSVSTTTLQAFSPWFVTLWHSGLVVGAGAALAGISLHGKLIGPVAERLGLWVLSGLCLAYGVAVVAMFGWRGLNFGAFVIFFSVANLVRIYQISRELKDVTDQLGQ